MSRPAATTGADRILEILANEGADTVFGYPGGASMPLYDPPIEYPEGRYVLTRHEPGAAFAAGGCARTTGGTGVCTIEAVPA